MIRLVEVFCATQRHQKTKNKKQKKRIADKGSHGFTIVVICTVVRQQFAVCTELHCVEKLLA